MSEIITDRGLSNPGAAPGRPRQAASFGASDRLRYRREFLEVQRHGVRYQSAHFVVYAFAPVAAEKSRLGVTVSRRIGNAVVRNRVKRRVRECYRLVLRPRLPQGIALVVIARAGAGALASPTVGSELTSAIASLARRLRS